MTRLACEHRPCLIPKRHKTDCTNDTCGGCLPGLAADSLRICQHHTRRLNVNATRAGELHGELAVVLAYTGLGGLRISGTADVGLKLNHAAADTRTLIRDCLIAAATLIHHKRGFAWPTNRISAFADYVATSSQWLAAHPTAGRISRDLDLLVSQARGIAYPTGTRRFSVGGCPKCDGDLIAVLRDDASLLPKELVCGTEPAHTWTADQWIRLGRQLRDTRPIELPRPRIHASVVGHGGWQSRESAA